MLTEVAADWLACFPSLGVKWLFDEFFRQGPPKETLLNLVPFLVPDHGREEKSHGGLDSRIVVSAQAKRFIFSSVTLCQLMNIWHPFGSSTVMS